MKIPQDLTREELERIVEDVRDALYAVHDYDADETTLDPNNEWDDETVNHIADVLTQYGLDP